ncbi:MAG TPA: papain-like cysteine protease family protein [Symbiobacteriaceae bacterium]
MQLKIEPQTAKRERYSTPESAGGKASSHVLDLAIQRQELSNWCWAAIAASLGDFYRRRHFTQHEIASRMLGYDCSCLASDPEAAARCDVFAMLDEALRVTECYSHWSPGRPTFERLCAEIGSGRPLCVGIDWQIGGSHYAVVSGCYVETREIYVVDPLHGPSVQPFDAFPATYRGTGGMWRGTFWTQRPTASQSGPKNEGMNA